MVKVSRRTPEHQRAVLDRRASNAAQPIPSKKQRRQMTRQASNRVAINEGLDNAGTRGTD